MNSSFHPNTTTSNLRDELSGFVAYDAETIEEEVIEKVNKQLEENDQIIERELAKIDKKIQEIHDVCFFNKKLNKIVLRRHK
jgi:LPS O-antigen subunit length determinant protein (WzzB/FepE family)